MNMVYQEFAFDTPGNTKIGKKNWYHLNLLKIYKHIFLPCYDIILCEGLSVFRSVIYGLGRKKKIIVFVNIIVPICCVWSHDQNTDVFNGGEWIVWWVVLSWIMYWDTQLKSVDSLKAPVAWLTSSAPGSYLQVRKRHRLWHFKHFL